MRPRPALVAALAFAAAVQTVPRPSAAQEAEAFPLAVSGLSSASFLQWEDRGSAMVPEGSSPDWAASGQLRLRAAAGSVPRAAFEGRVSLDGMSDTVSFELLELWAEWKPLPALSLKAGRQRLGSGSGFTWNPADDLNATRSQGDPAAARSGLDSALLRLDASSVAGLPLSLELVGALPSAGGDLGDAMTEARLYLLAGGLELSLVVGLSEPWEDTRRWIAGAWLTVPLGPLVLGVEGAARRRADLYRPDGSGLPVADSSVLGAAVGTATLRSGDFLVIAEGYWNGAAYSRAELDRILASPLPAAFAAQALPVGSVGAWHAALRLTWASGDLSAGAGALVDLETGAWAASARGELSLAGESALVLDLGLPGPEELLSGDELGLSGRGWSLGATLRADF